MNIFLWILYVCYTYDGSRKITNNRFLKMGEIIKSGELIAFDGYLVDIGELEKQEPFTADFNCQESNDSVISEAKSLGTIKLSQSWQISFKRFEMTSISQSASM